MSAAAAPRLSQPSQQRTRQARTPKKRQTFVRRPTAYHRETGAPVNNFSPIPNTICKLFASPKRISDPPLALVSGASQLTVLLYIMVRQWGDADNRTAWVRFAVADVVAETGVPERTVIEALDDLLRRGMIEASKRGCQDTYSRGLKPAKWDKLTGAAIEYRADPDYWLQAPPYDPEVAATPEPDPDEDEEEDEPQPVAAESSVLASGRSVEMPQLIKCAEAPDGARFKFSCANRVGVPMRIETRTAFGQVKLTLHPFVEGGGQAGKSPAVQRNTSTNKTPVINKSSAAIADAASYDAIAALRREHFDAPRDDAFAARVLKALDGAPIERLANMAHDEIRDMRAKRKPVKTGILEFFAQRIGDRWRESAPEADVPPPPEAPRRSRFSREELQRMAASSDEIERDFAQAELAALEAGPRV